MSDTNSKVAEPARAPAYESNSDIRKCVRVVADRFGLQDGEYFVISRSVFVEGDAVRRAGVRPLLNAFWGAEKRPSNAIVILSPEMTFPLRQNLGREIAQTGGTVVLRDIGQSFKDAVHERFEAYDLSASSTPVSVSSASAQSVAYTTGAYERYKYSEAERSELVRAYETDQDSESIVS